MLRQKEDWYVNQLSTRFPVDEVRLTRVLSHRRCTLQGMDRTKDDLEDHPGALTLTFSLPRLVAASSKSTVNLSHSSNPKSYDSKSVPQAHQPSQRSLTKILQVYEPLLTIGLDKFSNVDIRVRVSGGGHTSQVYAIRQAIAKSIVAYYQKYVDEHSKNQLKSALVQYDRTLLVADNRRCEPKKV